MRELVCVRAGVTQWILEVDPVLRRSADALEKALESGGAMDLPITTVQRLLRDIGPRAFKAAGESRGALKSLIKATKQGLERQADEGSKQARLLLEASKIHRRYESVAATTTGREL